MMKVLVTGAGGFLGRALCAELRNAGIEPKSMDFVPFEGEPEEDVFIGDVSDPAAVLSATEGVDGMVVAHMAPRMDISNYDPVAAFDINVKGTGLLFEAALVRGVRRIVLISTAFSVDAPRDPEAWRNSIPVCTESYRLSKSMQEFIARQYALAHGMSVAVLRPGYVLCGEHCRDKRGRMVNERVAVFSERRDIGAVAALCLKKDDLGYEAFAVMSTPESMDAWGVKHTCERLNWTPRYDFNHLPAGSAK